MLTKKEIVDEIAADIRLAFDLLKEKRKYKHGDINLHKAYIVTNYWDVYAYWTNILDMPVVTVATDSSFGYSIGINDPSDIEVLWLRCHREAVEIK
jgi:hypothetical protein